MPILAELVRVVIGVDTHKATHTAAVLAAATGGVLATQTVSTTPGRLPGPAYPRSAAPRTEGVGGGGYRRLRRRPGPAPGRGW